MIDIDDEERPLPARRVRVGRRAPIHLWTHHNPGCSCPPGTYRCANEPWREHPVQRIECLACGLDATELVRLPTSTEAPCVIKGGAADRRRSVG